MHSAAAGALALRRFGGLELGSGSFDFRHERWREMELSSWLDGDEVVVFVPFLLWDLARQGGVATVGVEHGKGFAPSEDCALEGEQGSEVRRLPH